MPRTITILGPVPPPRGGASIHVLRLAGLLRRLGHGVRILPYSGHLEAQRWRRALATTIQWLRVATNLGAARNQVVHVHYANLAGLLALAPWLLTLPARKVLTLHSVRLLDDLAAVGGWRKNLALRCLARFDLVVGVRQEIAAAFAELGAEGPRTHVMPAFLPPTAAECEPRHLPADLAQRISRRRDAGQWQLACAAYYLGPGYGKDDLYGVEALAGALAEVLPKLEREATLYVMVSNPLQPDAAAAARRLERLAASCPQLTVEIHVNVPLVPVIALADAFLRPSREDGDSVAIREALALGRPVWASDVVARPAGCRIFPLGDPAAVASSLADFLTGLAAPAEPAAAPAAGDPGAPDGEEALYRAFAAVLAGETPAGGDP